MEDAGFDDGVGRGRRGLRDDGRGGGAEGLLHVDDHAIAGAEVGERRNLSREGDGSSQRSTVLRGLDEGSAEGGGANPTGEEVGRACKVLPEGLLVDDIGHGTERNGGCGLCPVWLDQTSRIDFDALRLYAARDIDRHAVLQHGEFAGGPKRLDVAERNGDLAGHIALEDDGILHFAQQRAAELIAVGEDEDVFGWRWRLLVLLRERGTRDEEAEQKRRPGAENAAGQEDLQMGAGVIWKSGADERGL